MVVVGVGIVGIIRRTSIVRQIRSAQFEVGHRRKDSIDGSVDYQLGRDGFLQQRREFSLVEWKIQRKK